MSTVALNHRYQNAEKDIKKKNSRNPRTHFEGVVSFFEVRAASLLVSSGSIEFAPPVNGLFLLEITITQF